MSIQNIPPSVPKEAVDSRGTDVTITAAAAKQDIQTSQGRIMKALTIECKLSGQNETYSYLFSLDKSPVTGSVGRILSKVGVKHVDELNSETTVRKLVGLKLRVANKGGKLSWY